MQWLFLIPALLTSGFIIYQDFKSRRINLLLTLLFIAIIIGKYVFQNTGEQFIQNVLFCLLYFLLSYMILRLYFYIKGESRHRIISKIGWGDILLLFAAGCTIEPEKLIFFFTITFVAALIFHILFSKSKTIPLAAYLLLIYNIYLVAGI